MTQENDQRGHQYPFLNDFAIKRKLGRGGMGDVYLVQNLITREQLALKSILMDQVADPIIRRAWFRELHSWIELPPHPHVTGFRFYRIHDKQLFLFAEFVDGGTLTDSIASRKLTTTASIVDIAIQLAWGLAFAHEHQLVHQDVKPHNVLMTGTGIAKLTDFGLVAVPQREMIPNIKSDKTHALSTTGYTQPFCSPEQRKLGTVDLRTDIWSWGLTVLAMYNGGVNWTDGDAAVTILNRYLTKKHRNTGIEAMPSVVAGVLRRCFHTDPADRWPSFSEVIQTCQQVYRFAVGLPYPRPAPNVRPSQSIHIPAANSKRDEQGRLDRSMSYRRTTLFGESWRDPLDWMRLAFYLAGEPTEAAKSILLPVGGRTRSQIISDLAAYDQASDILEQYLTSPTPDIEMQVAAYLDTQLIDHSVGTQPHVKDTTGGREKLLRELGFEQTHENSFRYPGKDAELQLANFLDNKAIVLKCVGDSVGMLLCLRKSLSLREKLALEVECPDLTLSLALSHQRYAQALSQANGSKDAIAHYDSAIALLQSLPGGSFELARVFYAKARCLNDNTPQERLKLLNEAIRIYRQCNAHDTDWRYAWTLAEFLRGKALQLFLLGESTQALAMLDDAVVIIERLLCRNDNSLLQLSLSSIYSLHAEVMFATGNIAASISLHKNALEIRDRWLDNDVSGELIQLIATQCAILADFLVPLKIYQTASDLYDRALSHLHTLIYRYGASQNLISLTRVQMNAAMIASLLGDNNKAQYLFCQAITSCICLISNVSRGNLDEGLIRACHTAAMVIMQGDFQGATDLLQAAQLPLREFLSSSNDENLGECLNLLEQISSTAASAQSRQQHHRDRRNEHT